MKRTFKSTPLLIALIVILCAVLSFTALASPDANSVSISSAEELKAFAAEVNAGNSYDGVTVTLTADITLNDINFEFDSNGDLIKSGLPDNWTPIGTSIAPFSGVFNGGGHTISGLYSVSDDGFVGLFGHIVDGSVEGVNLTNSYVSGGYYAGGIVGYICAVNESCYIKNCNVDVRTDSVTGYHGNIAGYVAANGGTIDIEGCHSTNHPAIGGTSGDGVNADSVAIPTSPEEPRAEKANILLWIVIALVILAIVILIIVLAAKGKKKDKKEEAAPAPVPEKEEAPKEEEKTEEAPEPQPEPVILPIPEASRKLGYYFIKQAANGEYMFNLKAANHETVATSETYASLSSCKNGIHSVAKNAAIAAIEDQTEEGFEKQPAPKFEIYQDKAGKYRFRLKAGNHEIIAVSQGYSSKKSCKKGIESVIVNSATTKMIIEDAETGERREKILAAIKRTEKVTVEEAHVLLDDTSAEALLETVTDENQSVYKKMPCEIINIDTISENFEAGDLVNVSTLLEKKLVPSKTQHVKILARGTLDKPLTVEANQFSADAIKMIVLVGGTAIRTTD